MSLQFQSKNGHDNLLVHSQPQAKHHKPELKKLVASVFSRFQGSESFRKMKLRMNTDANVEMTHDPSIMSAVYVKPTKKINEHGSDCGYSSCSGGSNGDDTHEKAHRHSKRVCFGDYVEEICFRACELSEEERKEHAHMKDEVLEILNLDHRKQSTSSSIEAQDEILSAIIKAREEKEEAMHEEWQHGPGPKITFIPLEDNSRPSSPRRMLRQQSLRQKAIGHDEHMCELLLRHEEIEDEEEEEVEIGIHSSSDDDHDDDDDDEEPHSFVPKLRNHKMHHA